MILLENDLNLLIINKNDSILIDGDIKKKIVVNKFIGYWFNDKFIVAIVKDNYNNNRYIKIYEELTNKSYPKFICEEIKYSPNKMKTLKYINLNKSMSYFKNLKLIKNLTFIFFFIYFIIYFKIVLPTKPAAQSLPTLSNNKKKVLVVKG